MANPLFSSYRTGENRVTSSTMAVLERLDLALVQELLEGATGSGAELQAVRFENQVDGGATVPDARISARFTWWFETKTVRGGYAVEGHDRRQLRSHALQLAGDPTARLFVLTPDPERPSWFGVLDGIDESVHDQVLWLSFRDLADTIEGIVAEPTRLLGEQARFLLSELRDFYAAEGLLTHDDTVVVAARAAWGDYLEHHAYVCQPDRAFREGIGYFGFYFQGAIQATVPRILAHYPSVPFSRDEAARLRTTSNPHDTAVADLVEALLDQGDRLPGETYGVMLLTGPEHQETVRLPATIRNDTTTATGKPWGWTLGQRYTRVERLTSGVAWTSQL